ncbi:MAG: sugar-transfer associated ATP-grasp domain-containing protein, partial [Sneathiella sp.]|uniref:sugar-transfer associated ATP-grasp domain-containing protein n=1 Tax=Sneathiella sp. TaxID=1964365 RepID=UPI003001EE10
LLNQNSSTILTEDKVLFNDLCARNDILSPRILSLFDPSQTDSSELRAQLEEVASKASVFFKPRFGLKAQGAGRLSYGGTDRWSVKIGSEDIIHVIWEQLFNQLLSFNKPLIFQENLTNHPKLAEFNTSALNTIRLCTFRRKGELHVLEAKLKLGKKGSIADTGGLGVPILLKSQTLTAGTSRQIEDLPFSKQSIEPGEKCFVGLKVPFFNEAVALGLAVHECFPDIFSLGHDIAILPDGPIVIETNHIWADNQKIFGRGIGANRFYIESILKTAEIREM